MTVYPINQGLIRGVPDPNGQEWFVGKDVCATLKFRDLGKALAGIQPEHIQEVGVGRDCDRAVFTVRAIDSIGLADALLRSITIQGQQVRQWICAKILPLLLGSESYGGYLLSLADNQAQMDALMGKN